MAQIEQVPTNWTRESRNIIQRNFDRLAQLDYKIMQDFLNADPADLDTKINGMRKGDADINDLRNLDMYGVNFTPQVNGVIYSGWVYANIGGSLQFGLAEQRLGEQATAYLYTRDVEVKRGWNCITLNFPVEQNKEYTIYKKNVGETITLAQHLLPPGGWADPEQHGIISSGLIFNVGLKVDAAASGIRNYFPLFEIEFVTNLSQIYKLANESVVPVSPFYVGDNPGSSDQFWFKPVGN